MNYGSIRGGLIAGIFFALECGSSFGFVSQRIPLEPPNDLEARWFFENPAQAGYDSKTFNSSTRAIRYHLVHDTPSSPTAEAELNAIRTAFDQWQSVPGTNIRFEEVTEAGPSGEIDFFDFYNTVYWISDTTMPTYVDGANSGTLDLTGRLAITRPAYAGNGSIQEADIIFNGKQFNWYTDHTVDAPAQFFVESAALHEIGHLLGLLHSPAGGTCMLGAEAPGLNPRLGLSAEEIAFAQSAYPASGVASTIGTIQGTVTMNSQPVLGAIVVAEDSDGNLTSSTLSENDGGYSLPGLPPGTYNVRVTPMDTETPGAQNKVLFGPSDTGDPRFQNANTEFYAAENQSVTVSGGGSTTRNFAVSSGSPPFRVFRIRNTSGNAGFPHGALLMAASIKVGEQNRYVGVMGADLPTSDATLEITDDDLIVGEPIFRPKDQFSSMNLILVPVSVPVDATPGLRSFVIRHEGVVVYANGFLEIAPEVQDFNFDGLDDDFQRTYFPVFTTAEAAPTKDPDDDGHSNEIEAVNHTDPTDASSFFFEIESITPQQGGVLLTWQSVVGRGYQVYGRPEIDGQDWTGIGDPVFADGTTSELFVPNSQNEFDFYLVGKLP